MDMENVDILERLKNAATFEEFDLSLFEELFNSEELLDRCDVINTISRYAYKACIIDAIISATEDKEYLVRCEAYDALSQGNEIISLPVLLNSLYHERNTIARTYIVSSLTSISNRNRQIIESAINQIMCQYLIEKKLRVQLAYFCLFYSYSKNLQHIKNVLFYLNERDYHLRCCVINLVMEVVDKKSRSYVERVFKARKIIENNYAVISTLDKSLVDLANI